MWEVFVLSHGERIVISSPMSEEKAFQFCRELEDTAADSSTYGMQPCKTDWNALGKRLRTRHS